MKDLEKDALSPADVKFNDQGLVPCIVQDCDTKNVLMMAWMNAESLRLTIEQRTTWFYSRSRQKLWHKGEESGNTQELVALHYDCDADTLLALVRPVGPACHTGNVTCFYRAFAEGETEPADEEFKNEFSMEERGFTRTLGIRTLSVTPTCCKMDLPVSSRVWQPVGFLHGGATITLLESCASKASWARADLERELSFGSHIDIRHVSPAKDGVVHGVASLEREEDMGSRGRKEYWHVEATDDDGRVISTGTITCRVVTKEYFAQK